ncbi:MAG: hypothetical protein IT173_11825 [Acidobacteria bacterium]|nr:hypothetical protein [Acidobacteriota bacterium]
MKRLINVVLLAFVSVSCVGPHKNSNLKEFTSDDAGFKISLPCSPQIRRKDEYTYKAGKRYGYDFECDSAEKKIKLFFGDHNPDSGETTEKFLEYSKGDIEFAFRDSNKERREMTIDGHPGYRYVITYKNGAYSIVYLAANDKGIFHLMIGPFVGSEHSKANEEESDQIIDTFHFLK